MVHEKKYTEKKSMKNISEIIYDMSRKGLSA